MDWLTCPCHVAPSALTREEDGCHGRRLGGTRRQVRCLRGELKWHVLKIQAKKTAIVWKRNTSTWVPVLVFSKSTQNRAFVHRVASQMYFIQIKSNQKSLNSSIETTSTIPSLFFWQRHNNHKVNEIVKLRRVLIFSLSNNIDLERRDCLMINLL